MGTYKVLSWFCLFFSNGSQTALTMLPKAFKEILKSLQIFERSNLGVMTNINIWAPLSLSHNFVYFFSNGLQRDLTMLPKAFKTVFKTFQNFELVIWVPQWVISIFGHLCVSLTISFIFLKWFSQVTLNNLNLFEICVLGAKDTSIIIMVNLKVAQNIRFFIFVQCFVSGVVKTPVWVPMARWCALLK